MFRCSLRWDVFNLEGKIVVVSGQEFDGEEDETRRIL